MEEVSVEQKYVDYIENLLKDVGSILPKDINKLQQDYLFSNIRHASLLLASSMQTDAVFNRLDFSEQCMYIQIMAEWSFHKEIDLFRSGIPAKYWKIVMQKIWYTIWEVMYACIQNEAPESILLDIIERYVNRTYNDAVEELRESNIIDEAVQQKAKDQSNIEIMAREYKKKLEKNKIKRIIFYMFLFLVVSGVVTYLILKFHTVGIIIILSILVIYNILPLKK